MRQNRKHRLWLMVFTGILLAACSRQNLPAHDKWQSYIDARLQFALSYPASWAPYLSATGSGPYAPYAVTWYIPEKGQNNDISMLVVSIPRQDMIPGVTPQSILIDLYQDLDIDSRAEELLPGGQAVKLQGKNRHRTVWAWGLETDNRFYLLSVASPPAEFKKQEKLFEMIASTLEPLE